MNKALVYPLIFGGVLAGYFTLFRNRKSVDYVLEGREQRLAEGRQATERFRQAMESKLSSGSDGTADQQQ
eukprot:m.8844 g.8844  ORF g.8844 m.8844 type:complete len:70 (-) comp5548_c0_seq1:43-252(-)